MVPLCGVHHEAVVGAGGVEDVLPGPCLLCGSRVGVRYPSGAVCAVCEWRWGDVPDGDLAPPRVDVVYYLRMRDASGDLHGVPAVIDKDRASAQLAEAVGADELFILTAVDKVAVGWATDHQRELDDVSVDEALAYAAAGEFGAGSMLPKVEAAVAFVRAAPGRRAVICSLDKAPLAMSGRSGTVVHA